MQKKQVVTGIDIGTTKICTTVARIGNGGIKILGTGWATSKGLKKGVIINLSETIQQVRDSVEEAEKTSQSIVESAYVSVGGAHIKGINCSGEANIRGKNGEISNEDIGRAIHSAKSLDIPEDRTIIHCLKQNFEVDEQDSIVNPLGMNGRQLSVNMHLVLTASASVQNVVSAINKAGLLVDGVVMQQLASAEAVLSLDEKELGTIVIDIGGGTTDIAFYNQGSIWHSSVLPAGGNLITKDIAIGLKSPLNEAEQLKRELGSVFPESVSAEELIEISEVGTGVRHTILRRTLCQIIQARCDEILKSAAKIINGIGIQTDLISGAVLTGGGSLMDGISARAEEILQIPVRVGYPVNVVDHNHPTFDPALSTALGLLKYAQDIQNQIVPVVQDISSGVHPIGPTEKVKNWLIEKIS